MQFKKTRDLMRNGWQNVPERWQKWEGQDYSVCLTFVEERKYVYMQVFQNENSSRYLPDIYVSNDDNTFLPVCLRIQTTSYGADSIEETQKIVYEMQKGVDAARLIMNEFIEPLNHGSFEKGELIPE